MGQLESNFSYTFEGKVWNMVISENGSNLLFEIRNDEEFQTSFFVLDLDKRDFKLSAISFEEEWWIGITHTTEDLILFHTYENQDNPDDKSYFGYSISGNRILWQESGWNITRIHGTVAELTDNQTQKTRFIDIRSGEKTVIDDLTPGEENKTLGHSFHYAEGSEYFNTVKKFLASVLNVHIVAGVEYCECKGKVIISYYLNHQDKLVNKLLVISTGKEILLDEDLGTNLSGISDNTFFIYADNLIFVKEKHHFFIYPLTDQ